MMYPIDLQTPMTRLLLLLTGVVLVLLVFFYWLRLRALGPVRVRLQTGTWVPVLGIWGCWLAIQGLNRLLFFQLLGQSSLPRLVLETIFWACLLFLAARAVVIPNAARELGFHTAGGWCWVWRRIRWYTVLPDGRLQLWSDGVLGKHTLSVKSQEEREGLLRLLQERGIPDQ